MGAPPLEVELDEELTELVEALELLVELALAADEEVLEVELVLDATLLETLLLGLLDVVVVAVAAPLAAPPPPPHAETSHTMVTSTGTI